MKLQKLRENCERNYNVDLVHQSQINGNVTVLMDEDGVSKVIRYHRDRNGLWQPTIMYEGDDVICAMEEFNKVLNNVLVDPNTGLEFICPECGCVTIECCQDGYHKSRVTCINKEGDHEYGEMVSEGYVTRWQCEDCGYILSDCNGYDITDNVDVVDWIKDNCK